MTLSGPVSIPDSSPFAEGRSRGDLEWEWGAVPARKPRKLAPGRPWTSLLAHYGAKGSFLVPSRRYGEIGAKGQRGPRDLKDTAVERRWALTGLASRCGSSQEPPQLCCALRRSAPSFGGSHRRTRRKTPAKYRARDGRSMARRSGYRFAVRTCDQQDETWLFEIWIDSHSTSS